MEKTMFDIALALDPIDFSLGAVGALVLIQFYPPVARIGAWIVTKVKGVYSDIVG
jgi:hypothetical protein